MTLTSLRKHDPSDMYSVIKNFPSQMARAIDIGKTAPIISRNKVRRVLILGLGGSAIGGDLLRTYISAFPDHADIDISVYRGYTPPPVDGRTLVVASSYSGNTEETLAGYNATRTEAGQMVVITTGGRIGEQADTNHHRKILLPDGLQPRAALAYSFFPLLYMLAIKSEIFGEEVHRATQTGLSETIALLETLDRKYSSGPGRNNPAYTIAQKIQGRIPVIYSAQDRLDSVNLRWRGQIQENAKHLAFGNLLPEMNHNEINGWLHPNDMTDRFVPILLRDKEDHERVQVRLDVTRNILKHHTAPPIEVLSQGRSLLARMFSLIHLGDWVSYYLAVLNGVDPMPVPLIETLKKKLSTVS